MKLTITHTSSLGRHVISDENGANFIDVYGPEITGLNQEHTDNVARLIVAAPDFISCCETPFEGDMTPLEEVATICSEYERLLSIQEEREDPSAEDDLVASVRRFVANMRAAYAKAKGIDINAFENAERVVKRLQK